MRALVAALCLAAALAAAAAFRLERATDACSPWAVSFLSDADRAAFEAAAGPAASRLERGAWLYLVPLPPDAHRAALESVAGARFLGCPHPESKGPPPAAGSRGALRVRTLPGHAGRAAAAALAAGAGRAEARGSRSAYVDGADAAVAAALAAMPEVLRVESPRASPVRPLDRVAAARVQGRDGGFDGGAAAWAWERNLTGAGEVIAVADTGLDVDHPLFRPAGTPATYVFPYYVDGRPQCCVRGPEGLPRGSKVAAYAYYESFDAADLFEAGTDAEDVQSGHGTHVASLAAGSPPAPAGPGPFVPTGVAPDARIFFSDLYSRENQGTLGLYLPADLYGDLLGLARSVSGARIHSFSWGTNAPAAVDEEYTAHAREMDRFVRDHRDPVILCAAGNEGFQGRATINSPAVAKNVLAIGSTRNARRAWETVGLLAAMRLNASEAEARGAADSVREALGSAGADAVGGGVLSEFSSRGPTRDGRVKPDLLAPGELVLGARARPRRAGGRNFTVRGGSETPCPGDCGPAGPGACVWATGECACGPGRCGGDCSVASPGAPSDPACFLAPGGVDGDPPCAGRGVASAARGACRCEPGRFGVACERASEEGWEAAWGYDAGYVNQGTSMATPIAAGAAALVRQHLRERAGHPEPSAALVRAALVNGAQPVRMSPWGRPEYGPDTGFGEIRLDRSIGPDAAFFDDLPVAPGAPWSACVLAVGDTDLSVTLAWTDPPSIPAYRADLVNDLDLVVEAAGEVRFGNGELYPGRAGPDAANVVERVRVPLLPRGHSARIQVVARALGEGPAQAAAVALRGNVTLAGSCESCALTGATACADPATGRAGVMPCTPAGVPLASGCSPLVCRGGAALLPDGTCAGAPLCAGAAGRPVVARTPRGAFIVPCAADGSPELGRAYAVGCAQGFRLYRAACVPEGAVPWFPGEACASSVACDAPRGRSGQRACIDGTLAGACVPLPATRSVPAGGCPCVAEGGDAGGVFSGEGCSGACEVAACPGARSWNGSACVPAAARTAECLGMGDRLACSAGVGIGERACVGGRWSPTCVVAACSLPEYNVVDGACVRYDSPAFRARGSAARGAAPGARLAGPLAAAAASLLLPLFLLPRRAA